MKEKTSNVIIYVCVTRVGGREGKYLNIADKAELWWKHKPIHLKISMNPSTKKKKKKI